MAAIDVIRDGIEILRRHPLVGRPSEEGLRELLISYGKSGYVALYSYGPDVAAFSTLAFKARRIAAARDDRRFY